MKTPDPKVTTTELATHLSISPNQVRALVKSGKIPYYKIGKRVRFSLVECDEALAKFQVKATATK